MNLRRLAFRCCLPLLPIFIAACATAPELDTPEATGESDLLKNQAEPAPPVAVEKPAEKPPEKTEEKPVAPALAKPPTEKIPAPVIAADPEKSAPASPAEDHLKIALHAYETGDHKLARSHFQQAIGSGLASKANQVVAWKYLGFLACANGEQEACRQAFRNVMKIDRKHKLSRAEAGHPLWGPIFKEVQAEKRK